jgi:hypothetical protein
MDNSAIDAFGPDSVFLRSLINDRELVEFKQSGVITDSMIKRIGSLITVYTENGEVPDHSFSHLNEKYIELRDKHTISSLTNKNYIYFNDLNMVTAEPDDSARRTGVKYSAFIKNTYKLEDSDALILPCSYIIIHYCYPCCRDPVTFTIRADDDINGFTRLELMKKAMERYHLIYYLSENYNISKGIVNNKPSGLFSASFNSYESGGVECLFMIKNTNIGYFHTLIMMMSRLYVYLCTKSIHKTSFTMYG